MIFFLRWVKLVRRINTKHACDIRLHLTSLLYWFVIENHSRSWIHRCGVSVLCGKLHVAASHACMYGCVTILPQWSPKRSNVCHFITNPQSPALPGWDKDKDKEQGFINIGPWMTNEVVSQDLSFTEYYYCMSSMIIHFIYTAITWNKPALRFGSWIAY